MPGPKCAYRLLINHISTFINAQTTPGLYEIYLVYKELTEEDSRGSTISLDEGSILSGS